MGGEDQVERFSKALKKIYPHCVVVYCNSSREIKRQELKDYRKLNSILEPYLEKRNA